jgi:hypothetical protein
VCAFFLESKTSILCCVKKYLLYFVAFVILHSFLFNREFRCVFIEFNAIHIYINVVIMMAFFPVRGREIG